MSRPMRISSGPIEGTLFSDWQATTQALQPMQASVSITHRPGVGVAGGVGGGVLKDGFWVRGGGSDAPGASAGASFRASPGKRDTVPRSQADSRPSRAGAAAASRRA